MLVFHVKIILNICRIIHSAAGQRINITLTDFSPGSAVDPDDFSTCVIYATISEDYSGSNLVCHGQQRVKSVYISKSSRIQIEFPNAINVASFPNFLIEYSGGYIYYDMTSTICKHLLQSFAREVL